jgi:DNA-binding NtrC family response regulator
MTALIVEDDLGQSQLGAVMLEQFDLTVRQVRTAEEAIDHLCRERGEVTLLLADIQLPGAMDGLALARRVAVLWPSVSLIVTSGRPAVGAGELPDRATYIPKPWRALDIVAVAERAARRHPSVRTVQL